MVLLFMISMLLYSGSFGVNDPVPGILRVFHIAVRDIDGQRNPSFTLCFLHGSDFAAGVTGIKFVKPVFIPAKSLLMLLGSAVSKPSLMAIMRTSFYGKVKLVYSPVSAEFRPGRDRSFVSATATFPDSISASIA